MKTTYLKMQWLAPVLGVVVVGGGLMGARTYIELESTVRAHEALTATVERLYQDQNLSAALKSIHEGDVNAAARRLDVLLCGSILQLNDQLEGADPKTRMYVEDAFRRMALARPGIATGETPGSGQESTGDQATAEQILRSALGSARTRQAK